MATSTRDVRRARTAQRILEAARAEFAARGFDGATIRGIATVAKVDPSLVMQHYGSKAALFASAVQLPTGDDQGTADHLVDVLASRLGELPPETHALVRSMLTVPEAADSMRSYLDERVANLTRSFGGDNGQAQALLAVSTILGVTIARHFLELTAFESVSRESLQEAMSGWLARASAGQSGDDA